MLSVRVLFNGWNGIFERSGIVPKTVDGHVAHSGHDPPKGAHGGENPPHPQSPENGQDVVDLWGSRDTEDPSRSLRVNLTFPFPHGRLLDGLADFSRQAQITPDDLGFFWTASSAAGEPARWLCAPAGMGSAEAEEKRPTP